jgi:hypothetical protein
LNWFGLHFLLSINSIVASSSLSYWSIDETVRTASARWLNCHRDGCLSMISTKFLRTSYFFHCENAKPHVIYIYLWHLHGCNVYFGLPHWGESCILLATFMLVLNICFFLFHERSNICFLLQC